MSRNLWVAADHHMGHRNIVEKFQPPRPFATIEEHDEAIIERHNAVVRPFDHVYFLGDVVMKRKDLEIIKRFNGHKRLVRGNHDVFKTREYMEVGFEEIYGVRVFPKMGLILTHVPIHPVSLPRWGHNVHGHMHFNRVMAEEVRGGLRHVFPDSRYICVSLEHTNYAPVPLDTFTNINSEV